MARESSRPSAARILIVESQAVLAAEISRSLIRLGHDVVGVVDTAAAGTDLATQLRPDLVLMDIPVKDSPDGVLAAERIYADLRIPVVFMTANAEQLLSGGAKIAAQFGYVLKPFQERDLVVAIELTLHRHGVEKSLRDSETKLRGLYELSPVGIAMTDMTGRFVEFNKAFVAICGYPAEELKSLDYWTLTPRKFAAQEAEQLEKLAAVGSYGPYEKEYVRKDGSTVYIRLNGMLITGADGEKYIWSIIEDITAGRAQEEELRIAASAFQAQVGIVVTDANGLIVRVNPSLAESTGYRIEDLKGKRPHTILSSRHNKEFYSAITRATERDGIWRGEVSTRRRDGSEYPVWLTISAIRDIGGAATHYVGTHVDLTKIKEAEDEIRNLAFFDPLTKLPNRRMLMDRLQLAFDTGSQRSTCSALLLIDLDNFKNLNDSLGHDMGDLLLKQAAERISMCVRATDTVARLGGDEFVVMLNGLCAEPKEAAHQVEVVAQKVLTELNMSYDFGGLEYRSTASIGVTLLDAREQAIEGVLKQADVAMYEAKAAGRNTLRFYDPTMQASIAARIGLETDLHNAIRRDEFLLYYQPQVDRRNRITGAEVLLRWNHPTRGLIMPDEFIPIAEETRLIVALGLWVFESACAQLVAWASRPATASITLSINVSMQQLRQPDFVDSFLDVVTRTGVNPKMIMLELTESVLLADVDATIAKMNALNKIGIGFALDDFGTGYSCLSYLKRLPLRELKIDRSFVKDILVDVNDAEIARTIVTLAQSMHLAVLAEGVESEEQRELLLKIGCKYLQGFLFGRAVPIEDFTALLAMRKVEPTLKTRILAS
jgi:diguanylate cyclase (GGDEF)-like protein/PAS domain S-box-containing protein